MDISDGLALDAIALAEASGVTLDIDAVRCSAPTCADALEGGEDHALLATFPRDAQLPGGFRVIGAWSSGRRFPLLVDGVPYAGRGGWDPYRDWDAHGG